MTSMIDRLNADSLNGSSFRRSRTFVGVLRFSETVRSLGRVEPRELKFAARLRCLLLVMFLGLGGSSVLGQVPGSGKAPTISQKATVESLFTDFLHYAKLGRFTAADAFGQALLDHADATPLKILALSDKDRLSIDTLQILVKNSTVGDNAAKVLELIEQGQQEQRRDPARIQANVQRLGGDPQQEYDAIRHLHQSGEYAIPWLVSTLLDRDAKKLWPRINTALPKIGKGAVNPLVMALSVKDESVRLDLIRALGEIGYPQAVPYLRKLIATDGMAARTQAAAGQAIARIEHITGRTFTDDASNEFYSLADNYYNETPAVRSDPRLDLANVWYWDAGPQALRTVPVPQRIFGAVMAMRCAEESLLQQADKTEAIALWLASNIRREGRLGLDVESGDPSQRGVADDTRPAGFPRALYFTQAAGPRYAHLVLDRAVKDRDASVALGAIEALRITAGESSLIGTEDYKQPLVMALQFPDIVVRIRAALALGAALPRSGFDGSIMVVDVLSGALSQTGRRSIVVADADPQNLNRLVGALRDDQTDVIGETNFFKAISRARQEFDHIAAICVSSDLADPDLATALARLRAEFVFSKTPVVVLAKPQQLAVAEQASESDEYTEHLGALADGADINERFAHINEHTGQTALDADLAMSMALQTAQTLRAIAEHGRTVLAFDRAEPALIAALSSTDERLQISCAEVLALAPTQTAQRSIAQVALDEGNTRSLRVSAMASLAKSARNHGNLLEDAQWSALVKIARDESDLTIRTAASQALGAINLTDNQASAIIRNYHGG